MIIFAYPVATQINTVTLPDPQLGNNVLVNVKTRFHRAMDGTIYSYKHSPKIQRMLLTFKVLTDTERDNFINFITLTVGQEIRFQTWENEVWYGYIITPLIEFHYNRTNDHDTIVEFEGEYQGLVGSGSL